MSKVIKFFCSRANEDGVGPTKYTCTIVLTDTSKLLVSSGTWKLEGESPTKILVAQSGNWVKTVGQVTLDSISGKGDERAVIVNPDAKSGRITGDGLVGGNFVEWTKT
jgi:hypothetical protein